MPVVHWDRVDLPEGGQVGHNAEGGDGGDGDGGQGGSQGPKTVWSISDIGQCLTPVGMADDYVPLEGHCYSGIDWGLEE